MEIKPAPQPDVVKSVKLPADLWEEVEALTIAMDSDFSKVCRQALRYYLARPSDGQTEGQL
jgi:metal-responsive CopG/Arc/MetJ family transcriptional regulator